MMMMVFVVVVAVVMVCNLHATHAHLVEDPPRQMKTLGEEEERGWGRGGVGRNRASSFIISSMWSSNEQ
jgi:hypothetical protein